jgi:copper chaperone CopZ/predicted small secreted protein
MRSALATVLASSAIALAACSSTSSSRGADASHAGHTASTPAAPLAVKPGGAVTVLTVHGLSCPLCATNVDETLMAMRGVDDVRVDLGTGVIEVATSGAAIPSRADYQRAITEAGFTLVNVAPR